MQQPKTKQDGHQDPLLGPENLRQIVKNLPSRAKHLHDAYQYNDTDDLCCELTEFFNYAETLHDLVAWQFAYNETYPKDWHTLKDSDRSSQIDYLLDQLDHTAHEKRIASAQNLIYLALGARLDGPVEARLDAIRHNHSLLYAGGAMASTFEALRCACNKHEAYSPHPSLPTESDPDALNQEINLYLTLLYLLVEVRRQTTGWTADNNEPDLSILQYLFSVIAQLRDKYIKTFPVKKLILLAWKVMLATLGGLDSHKDTKIAARMLYGLDAVQDTPAKCTPQELHVFLNETSLKYPTFRAPALPSAVASPLTVRASSRLAEAMGIANAAAATDLPYQTLFPPKSNNLQKNKPQPQQPFTYAASNRQSLVLPLNPVGPTVPQSTVEAGDLFVKNMRLSVANYQVILEREKTIRRWQRLKDRSDPALHWDRLSDSMRQRFENLEQFYTSIVPDLQNIVIVLLKLLLSTVTVNNRSASGNASTNGKNSKDEPVSDVDEADTQRNREILSKAISAILLLLLKWTKVSHVLKFEYLSQLLVDSGCLLLILKILGLQEITSLVSAKTNIEHFGLFQEEKREAEDVKTEEGEQKGEIELTTNHRNMFWAINFLRMLQMLTKCKTHRIMLLVQYKSSAILKRALKVSHPVMELYVLKVLKSQVPYLGRKWRSGNMKIISAIYLQCHTVLRDDWISKSDTENDMEDGMIQETNLRMLIKIYNGQRYLPAMLPAPDETSGFEKGPSLLDINEEQVELEEAFMANYEKWLEENVYNQAEDTEPMSPIPSLAHPDQAFSSSANGSKRLARAIEGLYAESLAREFARGDDEDEQQERVGENALEEALLRLRRVEHSTLKEWHEADEMLLDRMDGLVSS
ncbi:hypothetical protein BCR43DRAFT_494735 [Syncephalastrum racemosum]|uniref:Uncharacterized protein n=1 Tax=Syncephalastrum racemosum TaxID=13706 RepID=A0A1X2H8I2_SYNRA|nr:hypothetical protein BCR43DRAFT_494735 [Syncephalastrum racemosum]